MISQVSIRNALPTDLEAVIALDLASEQEGKLAYWRDIFDRYVQSSSDKRILLVAEAAGKVIGFIIGEVRAWEFGSPPCGWVFALSVSPQSRELGIGELMFEAICQRLKKAGISTVRTMVDRGNRLTTAFFRSQGLRTGRYIELEKLLDENDSAATRGDLP
jgi:ribosomal protein S18 acetylase RimI-like enzyme